METRTVQHTTHPRTTRNESITRWSRRARLFLGGATFVIIATFLVAALTTLTGVFDSPATLDAPEIGPLQIVLVLAIFTQFLLMLFYISFAAQNPRTDARGAWIAGIVLMPWAILPVYWWAHVWSAPYVSDPRRDYNVPGGQMTPLAD